MKRNKKRKMWLLIIVFLISFLLIALSISILFLNYLSEWESSHRYDVRVDYDNNEYINSLIKKEEIDLSTEEKEIFEKEYVKIKEKCEIIENISLRQECIRSEIYKYAVKEMNEEYCMLIENSDLRKACDDEVLNTLLMGNDDISVCEGHRFKSKCLDRYYYNKAVKNNAPEECDKLSKKKEADNCYDQIMIGKALIINDCSILRQEFYKNKCLKGVHN